MQKLLVANRGEIAVRILRAAADAGLRAVAVQRADEAYALRGSGAAAYLDVAQLVEAARVTGCDAIHPGYGFLSESSAFARACDVAGIAFVGPTADTLAAFGDKTQARALAVRCGV